MRQKGFWSVMDYVQARVPRGILHWQLCRQALTFLQVDISKADVDPSILYFSSRG